MRLYCIPATLLTLFLTGCCGSVTCDCFSEEEDAITLQFATDSLATGFRRAEIQSAYVVRYVGPGFTQALDTVRQHIQPTDYYSFYTPYGARIPLTQLFLPHSARPTALFSDYTYRVIVPGAGRQYDIADIELAGEMRGSRCCSCYRNTRKTLRLNGQYLAAQGTDRRLEVVLRR